MRCTVQLYQTSQPSPERSLASPWQREDWEGLEGPERLLEVQGRLFVQNLLRWRPPAPNSCVLDFGCGRGYVARELAPHAARVTLWDRSAVMRERARKTVSGCPNAEVLDTANFSGRRFDLIVVNSVVQYMQPAELRAALAGWRTHLAVGGCVVLSDLIPPSNSLLRDLWDVASFAFRERLLGDLLRYALRYPFHYVRARRRQPLLHVAPEQIIQMAEAAGLRCVLAPKNLTHFGDRFTVLLTDESAP